MSEMHHLPRADHDERLGNRTVRPESAILAFPPPHSEGTAAAQLIPHSVLQSELLTANPGRSAPLSLSSSTLTGPRSCLQTAAPPISIKYNTHLHFFIFSSSTVLDTFCLYGSLFQQEGILTESVSGSLPTLEVSKAGSSRRSRTSCTPRARTLERSEPLNKKRNSSKVGKASFFSSLLGFLKDSLNSGILDCLPLLFHPSSDPTYSVITNLKLFESSLTDPSRWA